jgi:hypothetical protein
LTELRPALNSEVFFETAYSLARDGKINEEGIPNLLQQAVTLSSVNKAEIYLASPPIPIQKMLLAVLTPAGRVLGYKDHHPKYSGEDPGSGQAGPPSTARILAGGAALAASLLAATLFLVEPLANRGYVHRVSGSPCNPMWVCRVFAGVGMALWLRIIGRGILRSKLFGRCVCTS